MEAHNLIHKRRELLGKIIFIILTVIIIFGFIAILWLYQYTNQSGTSNDELIKLHIAMYVIFLMIYILIAFFLSMYVAKLCVNNCNICCIKRYNTSINFDAEL